MVWNGRRESITYRYSWTVEYAGLPTKLCRACDYGIKPRINTDIRRPARRRERPRPPPAKSGDASGEKFDHQIAKPRVDMISTMFLDV